MSKAVEGRKNTEAVRTTKGETALEDSKNRKAH